MVANNIVTPGRLWAIAVAIAIGVLLGVINNYRHDITDVYVDLEAPVQLSIYRDTAGDKSKSPQYSTQSAALFKLNKSATVRLRPGQYDFVISDQGHQYQNPVTKFDISRATTSVSINPFYNSQELTGLLSAQSAAIQQALLAAYPSLTTYYTIGSQQLFERGAWYGAALNPINPGDDRVKVILQLTNNTWGVAATPQISIGEPSHPAIPADVVSGTDKL